MGCGCRKGKASTGPQSTTTQMAGSVIEFEVRRPGAESEFFDTRAKANEFARGKAGATIHRVRASQKTAA